MKCIVAHQIRSALNAVVEWEHGTCALSFTWLATPFKLLPLKNEIRATACVCVFFCKQYQSHQLHDAQKVLRMRKLTRFQSLSPCTSVDWMRAVDSTKGEWSNGFLFDCEMGYKFRRRKNTHQSPNGFYHPWYHSPTFSFHLISYTHRITVGRPIDTRNSRLCPLNECISNILACFISCFFSVPSSFSPDCPFIRKVRFHKYAKLRALSVSNIKNRKLTMCMKAKANRSSSINIKRESFFYGGDLFGFGSSRRLFFCVGHNFNEVRICWKSNHGALTMPWKKNCEDAETDEHKTSRK